MQTTTTRWTGARSAILMAAAFALGCTGGDEHVQTTFRPVSEFGRSVNRVFYNTLGWTMAIMVLVIALVLYVVVAFRERPGRPHPKQIHGNTAIEILWTLIPAVIVTLMAVPTVQTIFSTQRPPAADALEIEVIGHQWWWEFRYPSERVVTANQFVVPVGREVHLRLTSADVIHSFWVPRIGGKRDVMPSSRPTEGENPHANHLVFTVDSAGRYRGQCAEYCGEAHGIMAMYGDAVSPLEFDAWVSSMQDAGAPAAAAADTTGAQEPVQPTLEEQGRQIFTTRVCAACHTIANTTARGVLGPSLTRFGARPTVGAGARPNTIGNVEAWIRDPQAMKAGALMPGVVRPGGNFPATGLSEDEVRAVAAYLTSLR